MKKTASCNRRNRRCIFSYHVDGQLARANYGRACRSATAATETFSWDGLALIRRGDEQFVNEPHVGGGNPVVSSKGISFLNDLFGTTVGAKSGATYTAAALSAFGEDLNHHSPTPTSNSHSFYTGKPAVEGLGHAFLMRNYRAGLAKWQTADPMGYPENAPQKLCFGGKPRAQRSARRARKGPRWNQLAYCGNGVTGSVDLWGCLTVRCVSGGSDVRSSTDISVYKTSEDTNEGGVFDVHVQDISGIGGDITITLTLSIFMDECLLKNEAFVAGMEGS